MEDTSSNTPFIPQKGRVSMRAFWGYSDGFVKGSILWCHFGILPSSPENG